MDTATEKEELRGSIEQKFNARLDQLNTDYVSRQESLEASHRSAVQEVRKAKEAAFAEAGLNPDGSSPPPAREGTPPEYAKPARVAV